MYLGGSGAGQRKNAPRPSGCRRLRHRVVRYSVLWRVPEAEVMLTSVELGISQIAYSPLAQGVLTGKYLPGRVPPAGSRADRKYAFGSIRR